MTGSLFKMLRIHQWSKNGFVFAGWLFGGHFRELHIFLLDCGVFVVFCAISSAVYILNDIVDREYDRLHPRKRSRPLASGAVSVRAVAVLGTGLSLGALLGAWTLGLSTLLCVMLYVANNLLYSVFLKHIAILDVLSIAFGFVLRLVAGVYVLGELPTAWVVMCTLFLAIFLGIAKRRAELRSIDGQEALQRPVLSDYSIIYLDNLLSTAASMTILSYALFTVESGKNPTLILTLPIVYYAIMHYKRLVMVSAYGEEPDKILLKDRLIPGLILLWLITYFVIEYSGIRLLR